MPWSVWLARFIEGWVGLGVMVGIGVAAGGAARLAPDARTVSPGFRALVIPGAVFLWPWLLVRMARGSRS